MMGAEGFSPVRSFPILNFGHLEDVLCEKVTQ